MFGRNKMAALMAEFLGVAVLILSILAVSKSGVGFSVFLAGSVALALGMLVMTVGTHTVGHFNPAVTLGLWTARKVATFEAIGYIAAQFLGALAAWQLYEYLTNQPLRTVSTQGFDWRVLTAELVGAFIFSFGVASAVYQAQVGFRWAVTAGLSLFVGVLLASIASVGVINPAVALGVQSWSKAYVIGPLVGGILGVNFYSLMFAPVGAAQGRSASASPLTLRLRSVLSRNRKVAAKKKK